MCINAFLSPYIFKSLHKVVIAAFAEIEKSKFMSFFWDLEISE